jgi:hypothetical protein
LTVAFLLRAPAASAVTIDWIAVGDPGNAADGVSPGNQEGE